MYDETSPNHIDTKNTKWATPPLRCAQLVAPYVWRAIMWWQHASTFYMC